MALLILALLQRIFLMSSLMLLLVWLIDRKSGSAGMPRPISYAVFCLKKKKTTIPSHTPPALEALNDTQLARPRSFTRSQHGYADLTDSADVVHELVYTD